MPGLVVDTTTLVDPELGYPTSVASMVDKLRASGEAFALDLAEALEGVQGSLDDIHRALRQNVPEVHSFVVTDLFGNVIVRLGELPTLDGRILYGAQILQLFVGGTTGTGDPEDAPFFTNSLGQLTIGGSGWINVQDPYGLDAAWIGTQFDVLPVTGAVDNGATLIRLTVTAHTLLTGDSVRVLEVGGVENARGTFLVTVINANTIDLQNSVFDGTYTSGGSVDRLLHISDATDNGSGLIRIEYVDHEYESGDTVHMADVGGVPDANGEWIIEVVDEDNFDLLGSTFAGAFTGTGTALRFFAGGLFQTMAIGPSFVDYRLRAFADGTLRIRNATIELISADGEIILDPSVPKLTVRSFITDFQTRLELGLVFIEDLSGGGAFPRWEMSPSLISLVNDGGQPAVSFTFDGSGDGLVTVFDGGAQGIVLNGNGGVVTATTVSATNVNASTVDSGSYEASGVPGVAATLTTIAGAVSFTTASAITSVDFGASTTTSASFVTGGSITTETHDFAAGIMTS